MTVRGTLLVGVVSAAFLVAGCQGGAGQGSSRPPAALTGVQESQAEARAIEMAKKATTLHDRNAGRTAQTGGSSGEPADHSNVAEIREQLSHDQGPLSDGRWMASQLEGDTYQVIYAYKMNNIDYSYRFLVYLSSGKVKLS